MFSYAKTPTPVVIHAFKTKGNEIERVEKLKDIVEQPSEAQKQSTNIK